MLKITPDPPAIPITPFIANDALSHEEALVRASDLLRCAMATAYECGDNLSGSQRALAFSAVHLIEMAHTLLERSLR
ncbi:DUF3077 domain-containing protein [Pseudomonas cichorii]|nr:DUF3077 domain-containing protein [Pseudomonas cichorii]